MKTFSDTVRTITAGGLATILLSFAVPQTVQAHDDARVGPHVHRTIESNRKKITVRGERYVPTIWVDPDGCQHWVMDDGAEGYMTPNVNRHGIPICNRGNACGVMNTDQLFATDSFSIHARGRKMLTDFFRSAKASAFVIVGHTDSRASDGYNMRLSYNRAKAVASIGQAAGARVVDIRGYGERVPKASNATAQGRRENRRVEILCIR